MEKAVLITGASSGFGKEFAKLYAKDKNNLVLVARSEDTLNQIKAELEDSYGITVYVYAKDLSVPQAAKEVFAFTEQKDICVTTLINNAGYGDWCEFTQADPAKLDAMIQLNITALFQLCRLYAPIMKQNKSGSILNVSSLAAFSAGPLMATYYATKAFVLSLSESLAEELKPYGVTVSALCPGPANTGFVQKAELSSSSFAKAFSHMSAKKVAEYAYKKHKAKKTIILPGLLPKLMVFGARLAPRSLCRKVVMSIQKK